MTETTEQEFDSSLIGQRQLRIEKLQKLAEMGIDPYPATSARTNLAQELHDKYENLEGQEVTLSGRIMSWREHGALVFADLKDKSGSVQLYIKQDTINDTDSDNQTLGFDDLNLLDVGDIVEASGVVTKTKRGEISLEVRKIKLLTKSIRPFPNSLEDKEERYRRRYLDLLINDGRKELFKRKAKFWEANRKFMQDNGFIEVEVPVLEHVTGGADARPFVTHHNDLDQDFYLRISTELYQKRLIGAGFEKIFTLGPNFRNEGVSDEHLQEFYQLEWYWAYADYRDGMELVKESLRYIAKEVYGKAEFSTRGHTFDLSDEWEELSYPDVIKERLSVDIFEDSDESMEKILEQQGVRLDGEVNRMRLIDNLWKTIRKDIAGPAFLINEPKFMSPLAKSKPGTEDITERFHVIIGGSELGNGYSELNDPMDQLDRFKEQQAARDAGDDEAQMLDIDFVEMLEYGMPPTCGYGHSERIFWFLEDVTAREGTIFPQLKNQLSNTTKQIYPELNLDN